MSCLIEDFLEHWADKYLWSPICNRIGRGHFDMILEGEKRLDISLHNETSQNLEDESFWKENITKFVNLYIFILLFFWKKDNPNSELIKNRFESYFLEKENEIIAEFEMFKIQSDKAEFLNNHVRLVIDVFEVMDSYLWNSNKRRTSVLLPLLKKYNINTDDIYKRYYNLLAQSLLKSPELLENTDLLFAFCDSTDVITHRPNCFRLIIENIHGENMRSLDVVTLLKTMPKGKCSTKTYVALLNFYCINFEVYNENDSDSLLFGSSSEERTFWIENLKLNKYTLLLPYVIIKRWNCDGTSKNKVNHWILSIQEEDGNCLVQEMNEFIQHFQTASIDSKLISSVKEIGFVVDSCLFVLKHNTPFLFEVLNDHLSLLNDLYPKYVYLLFKQIKSYSRKEIKNIIEFIIHFCKATDVPIKKSNSLRALMQVLSGSYNEKNLSSMLIKLLEEDPRGEMEQLGFGALKYIVDFYCSNSKLYLSSRDPMDIFNVFSMQRELWKIRICDYFFKFNNFITPVTIMNKSVVYPEGICNPLSDMELFDIWRQYAKPWNYIDFFSKDSCKIVKHIIGEKLLCNINSELDAKARKIIKKAKEESKSRDWANDRLRYVIKCAINNRIEKFSTELFTFLNSYKIEKIKECICKAFDDSRLQMWDMVPLNRSNIEIEVTINGSSTKITVSHEGENIEISFSDISPKEVVPLTEMYSILPIEFINSYIDSYRNLLGWKDSPTASKMEKSMEILTSFFKKYKALAQSVVVFYFDFSYMNAINKKKNDKNKEDSYSTNKSGNHNQHNSGSLSSDFEDDPRTDPATSWIYQP